MNRDQYLTKQRQFSEKSAKSDGRKGTLAGYQFVADWSPGNSQAQGSALSDPTDKAGSL